MDWTLFVFSKGRKHYLVSSDSEDNAWIKLQKKLSWNITMVKQQCTLLGTMNCDSDVKSIK